MYTKSPYVLQLRPWVADVLVGLALFALAAWFWLGSEELDDLSGPSIGPADFPWVLALLLGFGAVALICLALVQRIRGARRDEDVTTRRPLHVLVGIVLLVLFPTLVARLGYYPTMALWLATFLWLAGNRRPLSIAAYVIGFLTFTKVVFEMVLKTPLP